MWKEGLGYFYMASVFCIWGMQSPTSIPEFMAYMSMIVRINQQYAGMAWLNYDTLYRKHAALKKDTKWSVINTPGVSRELPGTQ